MEVASLAASALAKVNVGMTRAQVLVQLGEPDMKSENNWLFAKLGWVKFRGDQVFAIEAL